MSATSEWQDAKYTETFEEELRGLERRRKVDASCTADGIERVLKQLYIMEGADWHGRGLLQDIILSARIAAYEHFVAQWRQELALNKQEN